MNEFMNSEEIRPTRVNMTNSPGNATGFLVHYRAFSPAVPSSAQGSLPSANRPHASPSGGIGAG